MDKDDDTLVPVTLPSGAKHAVFKREASYLKERVDRYQADLSFSNVSDLQTLDTIVVYETLLWRWGQWLSRQVDYWNEPVDEKELTRQSKDTSQEVRQLKKNLGVDKVTRDKVKGEDCHDAATEVLTEQGWTRFPDLQRGVRVATRTASGEIVYQTPTAYHEYDFDGDLVACESAWANFAITGGHRMLVERPNGLELIPVERLAARNHNYRIPRLATVGQREAGWVKFDEVDTTYLDLPPTHVKYTSSEDQLLRDHYPSMEWPELCELLGRSQDSIRQRAHQLNLHREIKTRHWRARPEGLPAARREDFAAWLGLWLAEGHKTVADSGRFGVRLSQTKPQGIEAIDRIFECLGWPHRRTVTARGEVVWSIRSTTLTEYVDSLRDGHELRIPDEVFLTWSLEELEALWWGLSVGDGTWSDGVCVRYTTTSRRLADDVQRLLVHIGLSGRLYKVYDANRRSPAGYQARHACWAVQVRRSRTQTFRSDRTVRMPYKGKVYCVSVPNETLCTRREGQPLWSGNSVSTYIDNLKLRAKQFGINREKMLDKALELSQDLVAKLQLHDNTTDDERKEFNITQDDLVAWIRDVYIPEFQAVDDHFRENQQRLWIRSQ